MAQGAACWRGARTQLASVCACLVALQCRIALQHIRCSCSRAPQLLLLPARGAAQHHAGLALALARLCFALAQRLRARGAQAGLWGAGAGSGQRAEAEGESQALARARGIGGERPRTHELLALRRRASAQRPCVLLLALRLHGPAQGHKLALQLLPLPRSNLSCLPHLMLVVQRRVVLAVVQVCSRQHAVALRGHWARRSRSTAANSQTATDRRFRHTRRSGCVSSGRGADVGRLRLAKLAYALSRVLAGRAAPGRL